MIELASVVTYLELRHDAIPPPTGEAPPFGLRREPRAGAAEMAAALYARVGARWHWTDRLGWTAAEWQAAIDRAGAEVWVARIDEVIAGYFQLELVGDAVELKYFGLAPEFIGRGMGRHLLTAAIARARAIRPARMTVNTCTLDHPAALRTYLDHGFAIVRTETRTQPVWA